MMVGVLIFRQIDTPSKPSMSTPGLPPPPVYGEVVSDEPGGFHPYDSRFPNMNGTPSWLRAITDYERMTLERICRLEGRVCDMMAKHEDRCTVLEGKITALAEQQRLYEKEFSASLWKHWSAVQRHEGKNRELEKKLLELAETVSKGADITLAHFKTIKERTDELGSRLQVCEGMKDAIGGTGL